MIFRRLVLPLALALMSTTALAQTPIDPLDARDARRVDRMEQVVRELRSIVFQGRDSGKPVVIQPAETDYQLQELTRRLGELEHSLTRIIGNLEVTNRDAQIARDENENLKAQIMTLSARLAALETQGLPAETGAGSEAEPPELSGAPPPLTATEAFDQARRLMLSGDYEGAEAGFRAYVGRYGDSLKAPEARYWLGKTLSARAAHAEAASAYIGAIRGWPATPWAPDAVVELSRALIQIKKPADACQTLTEFSRRYPKAPPAVKNRAAAASSQAKCAA